MDDKFLRNREIFRTSNGDIMELIKKYIGKLVICPKCGKPGFLMIVNKPYRYRDKTYRYSYVVIRHFNGNHHLGPIDEYVIDKIKKLKFVEIV